MKKLFKLVLPLSVISLVATGLSLSTVKFQYKRVLAGEIGDYGDFEHTLLTDEGVSVDVSNKMLDVQSGDGFEFFCPMWIGEREVLDENVRYTYKTEYDQKNKQIIFSKVLYETGEVLETSTYDATTGDKVD